MNCPVCDGRLKAIEKFGVEVDICPDCKGVWLDRGELEKILEMVAQGGPASSEQAASPVQDNQRDNYRHEERRYEQDHHDHDKRDNDYDRNIDPRTGRPRRRESWLGQIFDAFGGGDD